MIYLVIIIVISLMMLAYMHIETKMIDTTVVRYSQDENATKIMQLSDIHISKLYVSWKKLKNIIDKEKPDVIVLTGDYVDKQEQIYEFLRFMDFIKEKYEIIMCFGNHDYNHERRSRKRFSEFREELNKRGFKVLENQSYQLQNKTKKINFIGIEDTRTRSPKVKEIINEHSDKDSTNIVISHNPEVLLKIPEGSVDYLLCGHFHGGQIWMPFNLEFKLLRDEKICKMGFRKGRYRYNNIELYINRGLGNVMFPLRFLSKPEISIFYI